MLKKKYFLWNTWCASISIYATISILASAKEFSYFSPWMDVPHVWGYNSETKARIKKLKTCGPPPLVIVSAETNIVLIWKAVLARQYLLYQTNYKNIMLEIKRCIWQSWHFELEMIRKSDLTFRAISEIVITTI